jgi:hypothetical protein
VQVQILNLMKKYRSKHLRCSNLKRKVTLISGETGDARKFLESLKYVDLGLNWSGESLFSARNNIAIQFKTNR